jgi:hypothetical protein
MAKAKFNQPVASFSGAVGGFVYVPQPNGSVVVRRMPETTGDRTAGQQKQQDKMSQAASYWRRVKADPAKLAVYRALPRVPGLGLRHLAVRDWFHPPVIGEIDISSYSGKSREPIRVAATDDSAVAEVKVQVLDTNDTVLEEGLARQDSGNGAWVYVSTTQLESGQTVSIRVTAKDHPDHSTTKSCLAYAR